MKQLRKFSLKKISIAILSVAIFCALTYRASGQRTPGRQISKALTSDTAKHGNNNSTNPVVINSSDTTHSPTDSVTRQKTDTFSLKLSKDTLDAPVHYYAEDSVIVMIQQKKIYLYGKTKTEYTDITLTAPKVELDQQTQILTATHSTDSLGQAIEDAHFEQKENTFTSDTILYNFKTKKGLTKNTITQQGGEIFVHGELVKKVTDDVTYIKGARFTTCDYDDPHFDVKTDKMKIINKKMGISGPAHLEFEGVPIPIYIPFGIYPLSQGRHSGMLRPTFETNEQEGLGLIGIGYYKVFNDNWDAKVYGNVYSYGSWSFNVNPTYQKRYHYRGTLNFGLIRTKLNFKGDPDYISNNSYSLQWSHTSDTKARPGTSFSANVNASSTSYNKYVPNSPNINFQNVFGSSITYSKTWQDKPYNLTVSANHSQNNQSRLVNLELPDVGFTVSTIYPFQRKESAGAKKWYEQLGIAYNGNFRNQVAFYDTAFKFRNLLDTLQWGAQHNIPITLSLPPILGGAVVVSPSVSYSQVWISRKFRRKWDSQAQKLDTTITKGLFIDQQASFGLGLSTALFGTYQFKKSKITKIRHVIRPTLSFSYKPDLSKQHFYTDTVDATGYTARFSEFEGALYSGYGEGRFGGMSFQLDNNVEMKVKSKKDTIEKKITLIDGYGFSTSYNFFADSMKLSLFQLYFRTNLFNKINISMNTTLDPYQVDARGRDIDKYTWQGNKFNVGRLSSGSISVSTSFQSKPKDDKKEQIKQQNLKNLNNDPSLLGDQQRLMDYMRQNPSEFVDFNIPWSFNISYSLYFNEQFKADYSGFEKIFNSSANFSGDLNITPKWKFSANGYYDFNTNKMQTFQMSISREMHCWQMSINVTPIGPYRFFNFTISPKSGILQDLRINRTRSFYTGY